ncbi:UDP-N-acetylmuramoylalanine--D-glutamate ligase [hydrothermal vent metagenome]|uniref:UDP-N-acetylmuramoylalanine--D-glutamate ligase n=1 Tax=hydrothermal vent metagenome TaxID=652676 RepID=A0A1W1BIE4_9ZZZZ
MKNINIKPTLFGYGLTTKAIASSLGGECIFFDDNVKEAYYDEEKNHILPSNLFNPEKSLLEVTTPSLKPSNKLIKTAKNLISEYDYIMPQTKARTVWISGTNGKTTTTQMITHILKDRGAISGGNIGTPLALLDTDAPLWILETSSYTLRHTKTASPDIYLLLPITPDHLDWHGGEREYTQDKLRPLLTMKEGELALIPKGLELPKTDAFVVEYDSVEFLADYFELDIEKINFKSAFLEDALIALAVSKVIFDEVDYDLINSFVVDAHRQEEQLDKSGRLWVNDSKATNIDASIQALKAYKDKNLIHLILGGDDKGVDLNPLFVELQSYNIIIYTIGANNKKLLDLSKKYNIDAIESKTIDVAIQNIDKVLQLEEVALLSPASASFDQFTSYKERGKIFLELSSGLSLL